MKKIVMLLIVGILISSFFSVPHLNLDSVVAAPSVSYYVSNSGSDSNDGLSESTPWRTIGKVNSELYSGVINDGDNIYFKRGDSFTDAYLRLRGKDGTSSDPMIFGAYGTGDDPIIGENPSHIGVYLNGANLRYYEFENLHFYQITDHAFMFDAGNNYNLTIRNCTFTGTDNTDLNNCIILLYSCIGYTIEHCSFTHSLISVGEDCANGVIRNCYIDATGRAEGVNIHFRGGETHAVGDNHYLYNVTCTGANENGFDISGGIGCENIYLKNCTSTGNNNAIVIAHGSTNVVLENCYSDDGFYLTMTKNTIIRNCVGKSANEDNIGQDDPQWYSGDATDDITIYNNVFIQTSTNNIIQINWGEDYLNYFTVKNNIFYSSSYSSPTLFLHYVGGTGDRPTLANTESNYTYNIWWRGDGANGDHWKNGNVDTYNWNEWLSQSEVWNDLKDDADLVNPTGSNFPSDFELNSDSPCIDAGDWLTFTTNAGSGTTISVDEANYFFAGISALDIEGDNIFIGDNTDLEITSVNYVTETITVNRSITWSNGDYVSLSDYNGNKPDIGAFEYTSIGPDNTPPVFSGVTLTESDPLDTDEIYGWINVTASVTDSSGIDTVKINITRPNGSMFNVTMNGVGSTYYYNSSTMFSNYGNYSYFIWANDSLGNSGNSNIYDFSMPPNWDINNDGQVTIYDLTLISNHFNEVGPPGWIREDVDNNGIVQVLDLVLVIAHWYDPAWWT